MGRGDRARRLLCRARGPVAAAAAREAELAAAPRRDRPGAGQPGGGDRLRRDRCLPVRADRLRGARRHREHDRQLGADLHLRHLLARLRAAQPAVRRRVPRVQPVEGDRPGGGMGRAEGDARGAAGAARLPGVARPLARGRRDLRLRRDGADCLGRRQPPHARGRRARLLGPDLHRDGALRRGALGGARRGVLGLLQPVLAYLAGRDARSCGRPPPVAVGPGQARARCRAPSRCSR